MSLSFRFKLLLAMMLVVTGVTWAVMYFARQKLATAYEEMFALEFESEVALFLQGQEARLGAMNEKSATFARSVRLLAMVSELEEKPSPEDLEELYDLAKDELNLRGARRSMAFYRFMNKQGDILPHPAQATEQNQIIADLLKPAAATLDNRDQEIGYVALNEDDGSRVLHETIITKIVDPDDDTIQGALILALPFVEHPMGSQRHRSGFENGIVVEGEIFSMGIQGEARAKLAALAKSDAPSFSNHLLTLNGVPHSVHLHRLNEDSHLPVATHLAIHSMSGALEQQADLKRLVLAVGASAMAVALLTSLLLSHSLTGPVQNLVRGTREIRQGNYHVEVPVQSRDELGHLAESFNEMAAGLALKEKYRSVLDIVADKGIAEELINGSIELGGEERLVSVLFCDIRGFTAMTEQMSPPEVIQMLNEHFTPLTRLVYEHHGVVDKFVGDLIMAIFGAPKSSGDDARNAVNCALAMIRERDALNQSSTRKIRMGIGIASGKVVAGRMGSADRMNYTVLGPKVNLASRLCGQAGPMELVIDAETLQQLTNEVHAEAMAEVKLKGFAEPVKAWKITDKSTTTA